MLLSTCNLVCTYSYIPSQTVKQDDRHLHDFVVFSYIDIHISIIVMFTGVSLY